MSVRDRYEPGVPCWIDLLVDEPETATSFYAGLFGWEFTPPGPMPDGGRYHVARLSGADVGGIGSAPPTDPPTPPAWNTYVAVASVDAAAEQARKVGGTVLAGPFDALPAGRVAVLAAPDGAVICLWEPCDRQGAQRVNEHSAWAMSALRTSDPEAAQGFYAAVFGWEAWSLPGDPSGTQLWRLPGYVGGEPEQPVPRDVVAALVPATADTAPAAWLVDFWIADADAAAAYAERAGGGIVMAPHDTPGFRRTVLADPSGSTFSVSQLVIGT